jgi:hypothetical protein
MAWHYSVNNTLSTYAENVWALFSTLMAAGWTDVADSDGVSTYSPGQQGTVTSGGTGVGGLNNPGAWIVLQSPAGAGSPTMMFQNVANMYPFGSGDAAWTAYYSPAAGFSGGTPAIITPPTASDQFGILTIPGFAGAQWFNYNTTEGSTRYSCAANDAAPYAFWGVSWAVGGGTPEGGIFFDGIANGAATEADDTDQHVLCIDCNGLGFNALNVTSALVPGGGPAGNSGCIGWQPNGGPMAAATGVLFPWTTPSGGLLPDPTNSKDQVRPLEFSFPGTGFYKGQTKNIFWEMTGTSGFERPLGYLLTNVNPGDYIVVGQLTLPWPTGTSPLI